MSITTKLNQVRSIKHSSKKQVMISLIFPIILGVMMGFISKYTFGIQIISWIENDSGIWIFTATLLAAFSRSPRMAMIKVFVFFTSMIGSYYLCTIMIFHFFPKQAIIFWSIMALFTPICAYIVWYSLGDGLIAALCVALPVAVLGLHIINLYNSLRELNNSTDLAFFFRSRAIVNGLDFAEAVILLLLLPKCTKQRLISMLLVSVIFVLLIFLGNSFYLRV